MPAEGVTTSQKIAEAFGVAVTGTSKKTEDTPTKETEAPEQEDIYESYVMSYDDYVKEVPVEYKKPKQEEDNKASRLMSILSSLNASESSLKFGKSMSTDAYAPVKTGKPLPPLVPRKKEAVQESTVTSEDVLNAGNETAPADSVQTAGAPASGTKEPETVTPTATIPTPATSGGSDIVVIVNGQAKVLKGKSSYLLVDVLDVVSFNLADARGRQPVVKVNGVSTTFMQAIKDSDVIELAWKS